MPTEDRSSATLRCACCPDGRRAAWPRPSLRAGLAEVDRATDRRVARSPDGRRPNARTRVRETD
ncbi:MAG TPA: hypothetical protein PKC20_04235 [Burkholderiaceae bacterium]|jgi:hypothetical protein|nr:hypothetical protein [Burkholderiaceae bacterium]